MQSVPGVVCSRGATCMNHEGIGPRLPGAVRGVRRSRSLSLTPRERGLAALWGGGLALLLIAGGWTFRFVWLLPLAMVDATLPLGGVVEHDGVEEVNELNKARAMTPLLLATNLGLHGVFVWGRYRVFRIGSHTPAGVRVIEVSASTCILLGLGLIATRGEPQLGLDIVAILLSVSSAGLFAWGVATVHRGRLTAAFSQDVPTELITAGPFRLHSPSFLPFIPSRLCSGRRSESIGLGNYPVLVDGWTLCSCCAA